MIDRRRILTLLGYNRGYIEDLSTGVGGKFAAFHYSLYMNLARGPAWERELEPRLRAMTTEERIDYLRGVLDSLSDIVRWGRRSARGYATVLIFEWDLRAEIAALRREVEARAPRLADRELLTHAISLKSRERDFLTELVPSLREVDLPRWAEIAEDYLSRIERWLGELHRMIALLVRVKVRLYAEIPGVEPDYPRTFQGWYAVSAMQDPETKRVDLKWWLTVKQIEVARWDFIFEWNWSEKPPVEPGEIQLEITEFLPIEKPKGIPEPEARAVYYVDRVPQYFMYPHKEKPRAPRTLAEISERLKKPVVELSVEDIIIGISSVSPVEIKEPEPLVKERLQAIWKGRINYDAEIEEIVPYAGQEEDLERARRELGLIK